MPCPGGGVGLASTFSRPEGTRHRRWHTFSPVWQLPTSSTSFRRMTPSAGQRGRSGRLGPVGTHNGERGVATALPDAVIIGLLGGRSPGLAVRLPRTWRISFGGIFVPPSKSLKASQCVHSFTSNRHLNLGFCVYGWTCFPPLIHHTVRRPKCLIFICSSSRCTRLKTWVCLILSFFGGSKQHGERFQKVCPIFILFSNQREISTLDTH